MSYTVDQNKLYLADGQCLNFDHEIKEVLSIDALFIVLIKPPDQIQYNRNVFAIDYSGTLVWRIATIPLFDAGNIDINDCPYIGAEINKQGELVLFNWCDTAVIVDPKNGNVLRKYQTK